MPKFTDRFNEYRAKYHEEYAPAQIEVDWDVYTKNPESPDETVRATYIYTDHLVLSSVHMNDLEESYRLLYSAPDVMRLFNHGQPEKLDIVANWVNAWFDRWKAKNPFSGFVVHTQEEHEFVGNMCATTSRVKESADLTYASVTNFHKHGYGKEAAGAGLFDWMPYVINEGFKLANGDALKNVLAGASPKNIGSIKILEDTLGLQYYKTAEIFGTQKNQYRMEIVEEMGDVGEVFIE